MTKTLLGMAVTLTMLVTLAVAQGTLTSTKVVTASVPFSFTAGDRAFPAGTYTVHLDHEKQILILRGEEGKPMILLANNQESSNAPKTSQLVFRAVGSHFFLEQAWIQGSYEGQSLPPGASEKELARRTDAQRVIVQTQSR